MSFHLVQGNNLADQLNAHFLTSETNQKKNNFYNNFFREVWNDDRDKYDGKIDKAAEKIPRQREFFKDVFNILDTYIISLTHYY